MPDFIPAPDDQFAHLVDLLNTAITAAANTLKLTPGQVSEFTDAYAIWEPAWTAWQAIAPDVKAKLMAKDDGRATIEPVIRGINATVQANPAVDSAAKAGAQLPVHKTTRTPVGEIGTAPMMMPIDNEHLLQRLWFVDSATPGSKARPAGAAFCEIRHQIVPAGGPAPTDPDAMPFLATDTKAPYRADLEAADIGKTAYYALRWSTPAAFPARGVRSPAISLTNSSNLTKITQRKNQQEIRII